MSLLFPAGCLVVVGMAAEATLVPASTRVVRSGGDVARLRAVLVEGAAPTSVLSLGIAGGIEPGLTPGQAIVATDIVSGDRAWATDAGWATALAAATGAPRGRIAGSDVVVGTVAAKAALHRLTGAQAVDMESAAAAEFAARLGLPFAVLRAVADPAEDALVPSAACGLHPDGSTAPLRVLASLLRRPQDLAGLLRIARQSALALRALRLAVARATA